MDVFRKNETVAKIKLFVNFAGRFSAKISNNYTAACAAQAAFFVMLSVVPLISLLLAVTTYLPFSKQDVYEVLMRVIPIDFATYVKHIINDLYSRAGKTVISLSAITLLWSASKGIAALMDGLNSMYQLRQEYSVLKSRLIAIVYTILLIVMFAVVMSVYVTVVHYYKLYIHDVFEFEPAIKNIFLLIRHVMGWLLFYGFILMMFVILPGGFGLPMGKEEKINLSKRIQSQMPGAAFSSVAWLVISRVVVIYIEHFPNFSVMYGSLAGIVIAMLWLYFCMYSLFIGAVINYLLSKGYLTQVKKMLQ
ncbi:MAG: YihY/virulence factor BrkB family protein [Lachnospiraceae bacterium]|nr:YihY/virulence factor BrkB family protein [Lachnospiraceae bacterium]